MVRADEEPRDIADQTPNQQGGMPRPRGAEYFTPFLLNASRRLGTNPSQAVRPEVMQRIRQMGAVPQLMAKKLRTSDPNQQAVRLLRGM